MFLCSDFSLAFFVIFYIKMVHFLSLVNWRLKKINGNLFLGFFLTKMVDFLLLQKNIIKFNQLFYFFLFIFTAYIDKQKFLIEENTNMFFKKIWSMKLFRTELIEQFHEILKEIIKFNQFLLLFLFIIDSYCLFCSYCQHCYYCS